MLESKLLRQHGVLWSDALPALELAGGIDELQVAFADPDAFVQNLMAAAGPAAKAMLVGKLKGILAPIAKRRGLVWEDIALSMDMVNSVGDLQEAVADPEGFLEQFS